MATLYCGPCVTAFTESNRVLQLTDGLLHCWECGRPARVLKVRTCVECGDEFLDQNSTSHCDECLARWVL